MNPVFDPTQWLDNEHPALRRCWHPVAWSSEIVDGEPLAVELLGEKWCLVRLGGVLTAFADACPHRASPLSAGVVVGDALQCAYHGLRFAADGRCVEVPALSPGVPIPAGANCRTAASVTEAVGVVWIALEEPVTPLPVVPEHDDPSFVHCPLPVTEWNASAGQMTDNFLDIAHVPFLHEATFGDSSDVVIGDYTLERKGLQFEVRHRQMTKALADSHHPQDGYRVVERENFYIFTPPHHVYLRITYFDENAVLAISFCHQPVNASTTRLFCTDYRNDIAHGDDAAREEAIAFQLAVAAEDRALLERIHRKAIPLDPKAEFHSKVDRITLEMRRIMAEIASME